MTDPAAAIRNLKNILQEEVHPDEWQEAIDLLSRTLALWQPVVEAAKDIADNYRQDPNWPDKLPWKMRNLFDALAAVDRMKEGGCAGNK